MKNKLYQIGNYVLVFKTMMRDKQGDKVTWRKAIGYISAMPRLGQVVGLTTKYDGEIVEDYFSEEGFLTGKNCWFEPSKSHRFWLVRFGLSNKPVCVAEEDMRLAVWGEIHELPYSYPPQKEMSKRDKQYLSEDSKHWPRDAKGRWVKEPTV